MSEGLLRTNAEALDATCDVQRRTKAALVRIQRQAAQTQDLGEETLTSLQRQRKQAGRIQDDAKRAEYELDKTDRALNKFDRWGGRFFGGRKRASKREAKAAAKAGVLKVGSGAGVGGAGRAKSRRAVPVRPNAPAANAPAPAETNGGNGEGLSNEDRARMKDIRQTDEDIDDMLGAMAGALDDLNELSLRMKEEADAQNRQMDAVAETIDATNRKQAVVNGRVQRSLVGKWKHRK